MFKFKRQQAAGANCSAMEQRPFQKRVQLKNHKSRGNKMKKVFLIFIAVIGFGISANAECVNFDLSFESKRINGIEFSITFPKINNCEFMLSQQVEGETGWRYPDIGTYEIVGNINYGGQNTIHFYMNGSVILKGTIYFHTQKMWELVLENGLVMTRVL